MSRIFSSPKKLSIVLSIVAGSLAVMQMPQQRQVRPEEN